MMPEVTYIVQWREGDASDEDLWYFYDERSTYDLARRVVERIASRAAWIGRQARIVRKESFFVEIERTDVL